ncbi:hypothetical protein [Bacillus sp. mrc49]|uniref:hypothetical protein n=1 Tax=Bacillus sp. mrc49 TaxID=2054913 RepID=UPI000C2737A7|nr:hypothetical protein [Bacillus sp. mrc49]PJN87662.1 hypothetical protein CVN76_24770 [Bacillus sp. mrc49]
MNTTVKPELALQDLLVKMSIDPKWSPDIKDGKFQQTVKKMNKEGLLQLNVSAFHSERKGRWLQILAHLTPMFSMGIPLLKDELKCSSDNELMETDVFNEFFSSPFLWNIEFSIPHPLGYGKGIEKATAFIYFLRSYKEMLPLKLVELFELEYAIFKASYKLPSKNTSFLVGKLYKNTSATIMKTNYDVLSVIEGCADFHELLPCDSFYIISPLNKTYRINSDYYHLLASFEEGHETDDLTDGERNIITSALKLRILCANPVDIEEQLIAPKR